MSVLILHHSAAHRRLIRHTLARGGVTGVIDVGSGADAAALLDERRPPVLIVGAQLDDMEGIEFIQRVRDRYQAPDVIIIMVSENNQPEDVMAAVAGGADEYVVLPYRDDHLAQKVRRALERFGVNEFEKDIPPPYLNRSFLKR